MIINLRNIVIKAYDTYVGNIPFLEDMLLPWRANFLLKRYRKRREYYHRICEEKKIVYDKKSSTQKIRNHLANRGYLPKKKTLGEIHTFAFIPRISWHFHLFDDLFELGPVTEFNYMEYGYDIKDLYTAKSPHLLDEMNSLAFSKLVETHRRTPVDWIFVYANGSEVSPQFIQKIIDELGVPTVNMCFDDKQSWDWGKAGKHSKGQRDIGKTFDLTWTSSRLACEWYLAEGGRPLYLPPGTNLKLYRPLKTDKDIDVSFIGTNYGYRKSAVRFLAKSHINVSTYGIGWKNGRLSDEEIVKMICRSKVNLGMGGIGFSENITNVKGRDFDIPACGGSVYITSFSPDLVSHYHVGREIVCYRNRDEMVELIRYFIQHQDEAEQIARAGRERCLREHRWLHRYIEICQILGII